MNLAPFGRTFDPFFYHNVKKFETTFRSLAFEIQYGGLKFKNKTSGRTAFSKRPKTPAEIMEDPTNTFIIKTSSPIHFNDAKGALSGGDRAVVGVPNIGSDEGQVAGLVGGFGPAGIRAFPGRSQVLDIQIDRGAAQALFQQGLYRPGHGGVHDGEEDSAVGLIRERPADLGVGG